MANRRKEIQKQLDSQPRPKSLKAKLEDAERRAIVWERNFEARTVELTRVAEQLAERTRELGEVRKESQSFWAKVQRQKENLTSLNDRVNAQGAENAKLKTALAERTRELEAERATSHGLRLLNGTNDAVQVKLIKERDDARAEVAGSERERLLAISDSARLSMDLALTNVKLDEAMAESARLREALKAVVDADDAESNWAMFAAIGGAQALAKETT